MSLISYTPKGLKELLYDLADQLESTYTERQQAATIELDLDAATDALAIDIKVMNAIPVDDYKGLKEQTQEQQKNVEARSRLIVPGQ